MSVPEVTHTKKFPLMTIMLLLIASFEILALVDFGFPLLLRQIFFVVFVLCWVVLAILDVKGMVV